MSAPLASRAFIFSSAIAIETSGILTEKVPPNPQQSSSFSHSQYLQPLNVAQELPRLLEHPELPPLVATGVEDRLPLVPRLEVLHLQNVDQEVRELPDAGRKGL